MDRFPEKKQPFEGEGALRACMRAHDWAGTPLGEPSGWPSELMTIVNLILNSKFPMFVAWGPEMTFLYNDEYAKILGAKHPGALAQPFQQVWGEIWEVLRPIIDSAIAGRSTYFDDLPLMIERNGGLEPAWFTFSYSPVEDNAGKVRGMYCAVVESTTHVEAKRVQAFQLAVSDSLRHLSASGDIIDAATRSLGLQLNVSRVVYIECDDDAGTFEFRGAWDSGDMPGIEGPVRRLDDFGAEIIALLRAGKPMLVADIGADPRTAPFEDAYAAIGVRAKLAVPLIKNGSLSAVLSIHNAGVRAWRQSELRMAEDTAERTWSALASAKAQEELRDANRRKDEFLAMLAHELRNPLAPIAAAAELMEHTTLDAERTRQTSRVIGRQVRHLTGLVDDLLDMSLVTRGQVVISRLPQDMHATVASAVEQVAPLVQARRHRLSLELDAAPACVLGDDHRLVQVLVNLLNNAAKYTPDGGHIRLSLAADAEQVVVSIIDNGIGIAADLQRRVFDLFAQAERTSDRSQGGLGLGLALVKSLVELHGGQVSCASEGAGRGSRFEVRLPRHHLPCDSQDAVASPRTVEAAPRNILIVDDNADAATMLGMLLEVSGHEVVVEFGSAAALKAVSNAAPAVCILDIGLPEMDGYELARRIRTVAGMEKALMIAVTGYGQEHDRRQAFEAGFDHHMVKPVEIGRLLELVAPRDAAH